MLEKGIERSGVVACAWARTADVLHTCNRCDQQRTSSTEGAFCPRRRVCELEGRSRSTSAGQDEACVAGHHGEATRWRPISGGDLGNSGGNRIRSRRQGLVRTVVEAPWPVASRWSVDPCGSPLPRRQSSCSPPGASRPSSSRLLPRKLAPPCPYVPRLLSQSLEAESCTGGAGVGANRRRGRLGWLAAWEVRSGWRRDHAGRENLERWRRRSDAMRGHRGKRGEWG
jgi:hypothetical protein